MTETTRRDTLPATITGGFWKRVQNLALDTVIPYQAEMLDDKVPGAEKSHAIENFRVAAGISTGGFYGAVFQDSDLAKWLEAAAYSLALRPDAALEKRADEAIDLIARAQRADGYLDTYFIVKEPEREWQNLHECHELYCAGHFIEAAVAYHEATGKDTLLGVMRRCADLICARFGKGAGQTRGIPGHEEIELALMRLYRATGEEKYLETARYFLDERGTEPDYFAEERARRNWTHWRDYNGDRNYAQNHAPVREQDRAVGHAVRAGYLYTAMADCAAETGDAPLFAACRKLWRNVTTRQMYVTGGVGSTAMGEAFTTDYDLPNDTAYAETCASIALVFFARRMIDAAAKFEGRVPGEYADIIEREIYNGVLSGMQLDGKRFFYVNPLEVVPGVSGVVEGHKHALIQRPQWFGCACCPPNLARLVASLGSYVYTRTGNTQGVDTLYCHLFAESAARFDFNGAAVTVSQKTAYPWDGRVEFAFTGAARFAFAVRIPAWCVSHTLSLNGAPCGARIVDGYAIIERGWRDGDTLTLAMDMPVTLVEANPHVREDAGKIAVTRGPVVYCLEEADNGGELWNVRLGADVSTTAAAFTTQVDAGLGGAVTLSSPGRRLRPWDDAALYRPARPAAVTDVTLRWIPYYAWANRSPGEMAVWVRA